MSRLRLMKAGHGDVCLAEWEPAQRGSVEFAEQEFAQARARGCLAFRVDRPGETAPIETFDETAPDILLVPPVTGG